MALTELTKVTGPGIHTLSNILSHNIKSSGIITATKFSGPLDSIGGNFAGVITATNGVFSGNISAVDGNFSGNVTIGGTLTYEDVTNIDSVGIITAQKDIHVGAGLSVVGVSTFSNGLFLPDNKQVKLGNTAASPDFKIYHNTVANTTSPPNYLYANSNYIDSVAAANLFIRTSTAGIYLGRTDGNHAASFHTNGSVVLYHNASGGGGEKFRTNSTGINVIGNVVSDGLVVDGNSDLNGDLDVDGHTNLDNVSIAGITTFSDDVKFTGANYNVLWDKSDNSLKFDALAKIKLNDSFQFYHNTNGVLHNTSGTTYIYGSGSGNISIQAQVGAQNISCGPNGNTSLYYAGGQKLYTVSDGVYVNDNLGIQDSIQHILDTNTKIRFPAADTVTIETAGSERLRIDSSGNVLIGTTATSIYNDSSGEGIVLRGGDCIDIARSGDNQLYLNRQSSDGYHIAFIRDGSYKSFIATRSNAFCIDVNSAERLRIGSAGQIGIAGANYGSSGQVLTSGGSGSAITWTTPTVTTINNNADNRLITGSGTANTLNGESNLTFDGSVLAVTGNIELPDDVSIKLGDQDDIQFTHSSGNVSIINSPTNRQVQLKGDGGLLIRASGNQNIANFVQSGCTLYHSVGNNYTARFVTTSTGITVTGEVAASQDYPLTKPVLDFNFAAEKKLDPRFKFSRASMATFIDKKGIVQYAPDNQPRFDHHPTSGVSLGLLLERQQTNYQEYSVLMSQANHKNNTTVTDNFTISPDGTQNASKIVNASSGNAQTNIGWNGASVASGSYAMWSIWVKSEETSCILSFYSNTYIFGADRVNVELADGTYDGTSASSTFRFNIEKYPNKWWRISVGGNGQNAAGGWYIGVVDSKTAARGATCGSATNKTWFAWGVQEEIGTLSRIATSYIPTNGAAVLRKGDRATIDGDDFDDFFDRFQGTVVNEHSNALQSIEGGGSGWEFNNDQSQVNLIAQTGSGYAHSSYPGCQASVFGDRNSGGSGGPGSPGTDYIQLYGPNNNIVNGGNQNGAANSGYGRYPGNLGGVADYTRYYRTWIDAMSYDLTPSTNVIRAATGGDTTEGTNTQSISLANVSKFELGNEATRLLYSNFFGRIKRWMYFDKVITENQLGNLTAQLPNSYL